MAVAAAVGKDGIDSLLVITQVILSLVLPFVVFPLVWLTSSSLVMRVRKPEPSPQEPDFTDEVAAPSDPPEDSGDDVIDATMISESSRAAEDVEKKTEKTASVVIQPEDAYVDYSNGWILTILGYAIWLFVMVANGYLIVTLALGKTG